MRIFLLILSLFFISQAWAAENAPVTGDFKGMKHTATSRVDKIIDQQTVLMKDGRIVRLLGLEYPENEDILFLVKSRLEKLLPESKEVMLYQTRQQAVGRENRMGHVLTHLILKENNEWINGVIVASGLAYVMTDSSNPEMADQLYALEQKAREKKSILWADGSIFSLLTPETAIKGDGSFRVVEGTVNRAATSKNNLYLNFGDDWRSDFTVMVSADMRRLLSRRGIDPMALAGKKVRVRGWIRQWNGPFMELETPERLEIVYAPNVIPSEAEGSGQGSTKLDPSTPLRSGRDDIGSVLHSNP